MLPRQLLLAWAAMVSALLAWQVTGRTPFALFGPPSESCATSLSMQPCWNRFKAAVVSEVLVLQTSSVTDTLVLLLSASASLPVLAACHAAPRLLPKVPPAMEG